MIFLVVLVCTVAGCFVLHKPIRKAPLVFYAAAVALDLLYIVGCYGSLPHFLWSAMFLLMQKCTLSLALFFVVMAIGAFSHDGFVGKNLRPIRAELSIIAWILSLGHMCVYLASYIPRIAQGASHSSMVLASLVVALLLFALLLVLGVTSFNFVKRRMTRKAWTRIQRLSYVFFALVFAHLMLMLAPAAMRGGEAALASVIMYAVLFGAYAIARVIRARIDLKHEDVAAFATYNNSSDVN